MKNFQIFPGTHNPGAKIVSNLPDFIIIGAMKAGTTLAFDALRQHNQIFIPERKENHFYSLWQSNTHTPLEGAKDPISQLDQYYKLFDKAPSTAIIGEASTSYLYTKNAPENIHSIIPDCKILCFLRNPVDRAYSHYLWHVRNGLEPEVEFLLALALEPKRVKEKADWGNYLRVGLYHQQLTRYYSRFPEKNILVTLFDDLVSDKEGTINSIYQWLEVDSTFSPNLEICRNPSGIPRFKWINNFSKTDPSIKKWLQSVLPIKLYYFLTKIRDKNLQKPIFPMETRIKLQEFYKEDIQKLQALIDKDLTHWLIP